MSYLSLGRAAILPPPADANIGFGSIFSGNNAGLGMFFVFTGVDPTTPLDVTPQSGITPTTRHPNPLAITPVTAGAWIAALVGISVGVVNQSIANMTDQFFVVGTGNSWTVSGGMALKRDWVSGAFDPAAYTGGTDSASDACGCATVALRPAAGQSIALVGGRISAYTQGASTMTLPLTSGLTGGSRAFAAAGDFILCAQVEGSGPGEPDRDVAMATAGYTEICDLFSNPSRVVEFGAFYKFV